MRRSLLSVVPAVAVAALALGGLAAPLATAAPVAPAKNVPTAAPAAGAASSKVPAVSADKAVTGYQQVMSASLADPAGAQVAGSVSCPRGTKVVGGGAVISSSSLAENLNGSLPMSDNRTWRVYVNNTSATDGTFVVYATCASKLPGYAIAIGTGVDNPSGSQNTATVSCPAGTVPLGGGGLGSSISTGANLNTSIPTADGWRVDVNNSSASGDTATAYAVCGAAPNGYKQVAGTAVTNPTGTQTRATASCRSGQVVLSGGAFSSSASTAVNLNSSSPTGSAAWQAYQNNGSASDSSVRAYAVCGRPAAA